MRISDWSSDVCSSDLPAGDDANFTHGTRFSALSPDGQVPQFIERAAKWLPLFPDDGSLRITYSLGQEIFTPERIEERELIEDDRPYAGWTYAGIEIGRASCRERGWQYG